MTRFLNTLFKVFTYIVLSSIILLNYMVFNSESYLGGFQNGCVIRLSPPYRFNVRIYSYDIEENALSLSIINGFPLTYCSFDEHADLFIVKESGIDIYIVLSSIFILFVMFLTHRLLENSSSIALIIIMILVSSIIVLNYMYFYESRKPVESYGLIERDKPLVCDKHGVYNICVFDRFIGRSKVFVKTGVKGNLTLSIEGDIELREIVDAYSEVIDSRDKQVIVAFITTHELSNMTYRRLIYDSPNNRRMHSSILDILTIVASSLKIVSLSLVAKNMKVSVKSVSRTPKSPSPC